MRIESIAATFPSRKVSNADVLWHVESESQNFQGDLRKTLRCIQKMLASSGSGTRFWIGDGHETSLSLTLDACKKALADSEGDVDLLICASVYSELVEPATSNMLAAELGLYDVECLDIKEACDGWMKAVKLSDALIGSGMYKRIMVVNAEFCMMPNFAIWPRLYSLSKHNELSWRFPIFTIGEVATATILSADPTNMWTFNNRTRNDLYDLCSVTPTWHVKDSARSNRLAPDAPGLFTSWATDLVAEGIPLAIETFNASGINPHDVDVLFTHSSSKRDWATIASKICLSDRIYDIYAECGNVVSAAVPAAMARALADGTLKRGDRVAALIASAGMSFSTASFVF